MSLIADALKAAQQERSDRSGGLDGARRRQAAASALRTSADFTPRSARSGARLPRALWVSLGIFALATAGAIYFVLGLPSPESESAAPEFSDTSVEPSPGVRPESQLEYVDLGSLPIEPAPGPIYVEYGTPIEMATPPEPGAEPVAQRTIASRAAAVIAAAQELLAEELAAETLAEGAGTGAAAGDEETTPAPAPAAPAGRFEIRVGAPVIGTEASFSVAVAAQRRGDFRTAVQQYLAVLERDPGNVETLNNLGASYQALGDFPRARQSFERAIALQPAYAAAWSNLGLVLGTMEIDEEALAALTEAIRLEPGNLGTRVNLALAHERTGRNTDARRVLEEVVRSDPQHPEAHYALGRLLEQAGDPAGAASHYRIFLTFGATRFPHLDIPVRERIRLLEASDGR